MQRIEYYSDKIINKTLDYFGKDVREYREKILQQFNQPEKESQHIFWEEEFNNISQTRYDNILSQIKEQVLQDVFHLAVAQYICPEFYHMLKSVTGQGTTLKLSLMINQKESYWYYPQLKGGYEALLRFLSVEHRMENFVYSELYADERLILYITGDDYVADEIKNEAYIYFPQEDNNTYYVIDKYVEKVQNIFSKLRNTRGRIFQLAGSEGRGKRSILKELARREDTGWIFADAVKLFKYKGEALKRHIWFIYREAILYNIGICFYHFEVKKTVRDIENSLQMLLGEYEKLIYPITVCTDSEAEVIPNVNLSVYRMCIQECSRRERTGIWKGLAEEYSLNIDGSRYGIKYRLNPGDIVKILENCVIEYDNNWSQDKKDSYIADLCMETKGTPGKGSVHRINSEYVLDDLKLDDRQKDILKYMCTYIQKSYLVYDEWKMEKKYAYGKGVTALFYGPPGTGKTMSAYVLSNELKMPLYRVDLSQVVDKYIGETEKHLDEIFDYAQKSNVILFFDEADSIFSKRTEIKDSKDKYSNTEVSFILQRIEEYDGIVILSTNYRNNIDDAFMRRMKYVLEFKMPDKQTRREIWRSSFSEEVPIDDIDYDYLADKVELSGGYIKNIVINAVFQAAGEDSPVTMKHIINSVRNEYLKLGKVLTPQDFEKYAYYLKR